LFTRTAIIRSTNPNLAEAQAAPESKPDERKPDERTDTDARRTFFEEANSSTPIVAVRDRSGNMFLVGAGERGDPRMMFTKGQSISGRALAWGVDTLRSRDQFAGGNLLDVGAEIGITAVLALLEHDFDRVIAIEPNPGKLALLRANGALNALGDRIEPIQVEPRSGTQVVLRRGKRWCDYRPMPERETAGAIRKGRAVRVASRSLNELAAGDELDPEGIGLIRIGLLHDPAEVLDGMHGFARQVPLLLELDARVLRDADAAARLDAALGARFEGSPTLLTLSGDAAQACPGIGELSAGGELKTAGVLALGD
jgi:FkbM family methyltransferase